MQTRLILAILLLSSRILAQSPDPANSGNTNHPTASPLPPPANPSLDQKGSTLSNDQIKDLIRRVAENDMENDKKLRDYTYVERQETRKLTKVGSVSSTESKTFEVLQIYGETVQKLVEKDDKPLSPKEAAKEDERIQKIIDKRKNESDSEREKRLKKEEKEREEGRAFVKEIADAYNFSVVGSESIGGRETWVIDAHPRPGYVPQKKEAKPLQKIEGRVWIDKQEDQWVKLQMRVTDTISFGLFIARLHEGTRVEVEQTRVNDEVWLPKHAAVHVDVRVALLKNFDEDLDISDRDYKKFHTGTRIVGMQEVPQENPPEPQSK
jgi:hypothetical protein